MVEGYLIEIRYINVPKGKIMKEMGLLATFTPSYRIRGLHLPVEDNLSVFQVQ